MVKVPARTIMIMHISRGDYPLFLAGLPRDARLPRDYEQWYQATVLQHKAHRESGSLTHRVLVRWDDFESYTRQLGAKPSYSLLEAFVRLIGKSEKKADQE